MSGRFGFLWGGPQKKTTHQNSSEPIRTYPIRTHQNPLKNLRRLVRLRRAQTGQKKLPKLPKLLKLPKGSAKVCALPKLLKLPKGSAKVCALPKLLKLPKGDAKVCALTKLRTQLPCSQLSQPQNLLFCCDFQFFVITLCEYFGFCSQ